MNRNQIKRTIILLMTIGLSFSYASTKQYKRNIGEAVQVTSLPISNKVVILDAGHGTPDERSRK